MKLNRKYSYQSVRQVGFEPRSPATFAQDVTARPRKREGFW